MDARQLEFQFLHSDFFGESFQSGVGIVGACEGDVASHAQLHLRVLPRAFLLVACLNEEIVLCLVIGEIDTGQEAVELQVVHRLCPEEVGVLRFFVRTPRALHVFLGALGVPGVIYFLLGVSKMAYLTSVFEVGVVVHLLAIWFHAFALSLLVGLLVGFLSEERHTEAAGELAVVEIVLYDVDTCRLDAEGPAAA